MAPKITNIVFSINRPMQLDAYLTSLYRCFNAKNFQTIVLWKPQKFTPEYEQLFAKFDNVTVVREQNFSADLLTIIQNVQTEYILFGIDDVIFFDGIDIDLIDSVFAKEKDSIFGLSLRISDQIDPVAKESQNVDMPGQTFKKICWPKGSDPLTRYPFELCATIYRTQLVKKIINSSRYQCPVLSRVFKPNAGIMKNPGKGGIKRKILKKLGYFFSPNTFESFNCRWAQNNAAQLPPYIYFDKQCASAIQVNLVNTTTKSDDQATKENTVEALNKKYQQGVRVDIDHLAANKPIGTHCDEKYFKLKKQQQRRILS